MKPVVKRVIFLAAALLLAGTWIWRYAALNAFWNTQYEKVQYTYQSGEVVPYGTDMMSYLGPNVEGYSIRVDGFAVMDLAEFLDSISVSEESVFSVADKVAVVYATLFNEDNGDANVGITLIDFTLHGADNYAAPDWELVSAANPVLQSGSYGIQLSPGTEYQVILPFALI